MRRLPLDTLDNLSKVSGKNESATVDVAAPTFLNAYDYADANPVTKTDPDGRATQVTMTAMEQRGLLVMNRLVEHYGYSVNAAAGIVGNMMRESRVLPDAIEGSTGEAGLTAPSFKFDAKGNVVRDAKGRPVCCGPRRAFSPAEVANRNRHTGSGPFYVGIGYIQASDAKLRAGLFTYSYQGKVLGSAIIEDKDAELDYVVEVWLKKDHKGLEALLRTNGISAHDSSDDVGYMGEQPGVMWTTVVGANGKKHRVELPRTNSAVQKELRIRQGFTDMMVRDYNLTHPPPKSSN